MGRRTCSPRSGLLLTLLVQVGCAPATGGPMGTGLPATASGPEVRVDEALPSVLAFPEATVEELWKVLPAAFRALGITAGVTDADALVYGNGRVPETTVAGRSTRDLFRCSAGAGLSLGQYRIQFGITAQPRRVRTGGSELFVQTAAFGRFVSASQSGTVYCVSNGALEGKIKEQAEAELARIRGYPRVLPTPMRRARLGSEGGRSDSGLSSAGRVLPCWLLQGSAGPPEISSRGETVRASATSCVLCPPCASFSHRSDSLEPGP